MSDRPPSDLKPIGAYLPPERPPRTADPYIDGVRCSHGFMSLAEIRANGGRITEDGVLFPDGQGGWVRMPQPARGADNR
jgi:hypothetical protein